jgi:hypothetical protein
MRIDKRVLLAVAISAALSACQTDGGDASAPAAAAAGETAQGAEPYRRANAVKVTATVEAIDHATRQVTLRGPDGQLTSIRVGEQARNLDQVVKGDTVELTYVESVMVQVRQPGEVLPGVSAAAGVERAEAGAMPGAIGARSFTLVATVRALDPAKGTATLEAGDGQLRTIAVRDPSHYDRVKVGDLVEITLTEALAIAVEKTGAR